MNKVFVCIATLAFTWPVFAGRDIEVQSFEPFSDYDPNFIRYGTMRVTKQGRNHYVVSGYMEVVSNWGNEVVVSYKLMNSKGMQLLAGSEGACDFIKNDKNYYPDLLKFSDVPEPGTCPIPKGNYTINNYVIPLDSVPNVTPGNYELTATYAIGGRHFGGYTIKVNYKLA